MRIAGRAGGYAALLVAIAVLPLFLGTFRTTQLTYVGAFAIALIGLNILTGHAGQISLGHGAFMALGAYTTAILSVNHGVNDLLTIPLGGIVAGLAGFLFGFPALRLAGVYLALATFGLAIVVPSLAKRFDEFTGGTAGILLDLPTSPIGGLTPERWLYYLTWAIAAVLFLCAILFLRGKTGRALRAIRENELAAVSSGVSLARYKTLAFGVSAFYAGIAGSIYAILSFIVNPGAFPIDLSILLLVGLVIGGVGSMLGVLGGAAFVEFVPLEAGNVPAKVIDALQRVGLPVSDLDPTTAGVPSVVYGIILLLVIALAPQGVAGLARRLGAATRRFYSRLIPTNKPGTPSRREA
ncbi:MAG: branched-chain amino acid ABC transporter permease [Gaiellaceae bacterium]